MKKAFLALMLFVSLSLVFVGAAQAKLSLSVGYVHSHFHYWEHCKPADQETANMNGFKVVLTNTNDNTNTFQQLSFKYEESGQGRYDGASIIEDPFVDYIFTFPLKLNSSLSLYRLEYKSGYFLPISEQLTVYSYGLIGYRYWRRQDNPGLDEGYFFVSGGVEHYRMLYGGLGAGVAYSFRPRVAAGIDFAFYLAPKWHSTNYMRSEHFTFHMGTATGYQVQIPITINLSKNVNLDAGFYALHWRFRRSSTQQGWYEPGSETNEVGIVAGITCVF